MRKEGWYIFYNPLNPPYQGDLLFCPAEKRGKKRGVVIVSVGSLSF